MGVTLYYGYYPKECNHPKVLPYLSREACDDCSGKLDISFYDMCRTFAEYHEDCACWVFSNVVELFYFASKEVVPACLTDYITKHYEDDVIFIIWKR